MRKLAEYERRDYLFEVNLCLKTAILVLRFADKSQVNNITYLFIAILTSSFEFVNYITIANSPKPG